MDNPFLAQIMMFGGNFAPRSWAFCQGQLLAISSNSALFSLLGTTYGGDGRTSFALPDMRGRMAIGQGDGPGLTRRQIGQKGGTEQVTLTELEMPVHNHDASSVSVDTKASNQAGNSEDPSGRVMAVSNIAQRGGGEITGQIYSDSANATMEPAQVSGSVSNTGGSRSHENMPPFIAMNYLIALQGIYPSRS